MSSQERLGRRMLIAILLAHVVACAWGFWRFTQPGAALEWVFRALFSIVLPGALCLLALGGRSWARWGWAGWFALLALGHGFAAFWAFRWGIGSERALTATVLACGYVAAVLLLVRSPAVRAVVAMDRTAST